MNSLVVPVDVGIESIQAPPSLWAGEPVSVTVSVYSQLPTPANLSLKRDGQTLSQAQLNLPAGESQVTFSTVADAEGLMAFEARVSAPNDARPENDVAGAISVVQAPPQVLIVAQHQSAAALLQQALAAGAIPALAVSPAEMPPTADALLGFQALILEDVSAEVLTLEQIKAIEAYVYAHGHGLIVIGGQSAYTLGAYQGTALEKMLPVSLEPPIRNERPPATLVLIVDRSGSMNGLPIQLAKEAAMRAAEIMQPSDRLGVLAFDSEFEWVVPVGTLGEGLALRDVLDTVASITASGGTNMLDSLNEGVALLASETTTRKHIVLLSDGKSSSGTQAAFHHAVDAAAAAGITVSTIAIGDAADRDMLQSIAEWGKGRYHFAAAPEDIPKLVLAESRAVQSDAIQQGTIQPSISLAHPLVSNFSSADFPPVDAYVALTARPDGEADTVLRSPLDDPLLASWQYGLGRVVAWTSDMDGDWTASWAAWPELPRFWTQVVRYALPDPSQGPVFAEAALDGRTVTVTALAAGDDGRGINLAEGQLAVSGPDGGVTHIALPQTAPGEYATTFDAPEPGAYRGLVTLLKANDGWTAPVGFVVNYPPEFSPRLAPAPGALAQIAALTGGQAVDSLDEVERPPAGSLGGRGYGLWLAVAALLLWPVEIAIRRRWMPWRGA
jgi:Ca-activated chloride channel homolog